MRISDDGRMLLTGSSPAEGLYELNTIRNIYLNFAQADFWEQLTANYASETEIPAEMIVDGVVYPDVGVRFRGNTSYFTIGNSPKKSFAISTDFVHPDQKLMGYDNLKFNNAHQDASFMREVLYGLMAKKYTPIAKANYIRLYLNGEDWGIYPNVQATEKTFLKQWFVSNNGARFRATTEETGPGIPGGGWGDGTAALNYLGNDSNTYKLYYSLKSNDVVEQPWQKLIDVCYQLSQSSQSSYQFLKQFIDIDKALWFLAVENIFTDDDSYVMKGKMDYLVYYEPETGRTVPLEYDGNSTFRFNLATSPSWGVFKNVSNPNYPLLNKLLNIQEYRQRYLAHYRTILNENFTPQYAHALIDQLHALIADHVASDTKKLYTTDQFNGEIPALKNFIVNRRNFLLNNPEVMQQAPSITQAPFFNQDMQPYEAPAASESAFVQASVTSGNGIFRVNLYYATGLTGNFEQVRMFDDGNHQDGAAGDGIFGASIPGFPAGTMVRYYIEALANNPQRSVKYLPEGAEHDVFIYTVKQGVNLNGVVINEFVASNSNGATDEFGNTDDWIELYNTGNVPVNLEGFYLTDNSNNPTKWQFAENAIIEPGAYLIVWADDEPHQGPLHATFKLSASGEEILLSDPMLNRVDYVEFGPQQSNMASARIPNGTGDFVIQSPTFNANNEGEQPTSVQHIAAGELLIFPNPATNHLQVQRTNKACEPYEIVSIAGERLKEGLLCDGSSLIEIAHLSAGVYFFKTEGLIGRFIKVQ
jgi:spore coat protein CotH